MLARPTLTLAALFMVMAPAHAQEKPAPLKVDKEKRTVTVACTIAPRKLENLKEIYPIEVIATYPAPKGQKAHETVVTFADVKPSDVHKALEQLGLKPGKPAKGEGAKAEGPEVKIYLEIPGPDGAPQRMPIEKALTDKKTGKPMPALKWYFTGSVMKQPDPEKDDKVYGADLTGTLIGIFPVTDETVFQTNLTMQDEPLLKLETNDPRFSREMEAKGVKIVPILPKEGTPASLIIEVVAK